MGKIALPLEFFVLFWNPKRAGVSRGMQRTGWDIHVKQVRQVRPVHTAIHSHLYDCAYQMELSIKCILVNLWLRGYLGF